MSWSLVLVLGLTFLELNTAFFASGAPKVCLSPTALYGSKRGKPKVKRGASPVKPTSRPRTLFDKSSASPPPPSPERKTGNGSESTAAERMAFVSAALTRHLPSVLEQLSSQGLFVVDGLLGDEVLSAMRLEAEALHASPGEFVPSQSTKWDDSKQELVSYDKHNVLSTQLVGGEAQYPVAPRLVEWTVTLTQTLAPAVGHAFPATAPLSSARQTNKLAVCLGGGSRYDAHVDNQGAGDPRKLTALYYLNPGEWGAAKGGEFRAFLGDRGDKDSPFEDFAPLGDRLLGFWSDQLVHSVLPSWAPRGSEDHRYALTVWLCVDDPKFIDMQSQAAPGQG
mmetsp:Transcript_28994/g.64850  ORF Transcript_28994/g.64850 Transcript_28994/m.64850 type:complete len:337 (+) Transcript_28994:78-1088(+)|eukprot:CAMPEP_0172587674 /NCGR_PEP_ID=MMETSP1068-20121228/6688_1 /TAXON_ID=35684 /ORGANISM="Pseudopedinella elastica, Strain CCMP716" /LENGTH=336 /DNA_ID=CAMNT_0013382767 /DNA_START=77 /DNA_END=1087 /DNA_ORIENTATION=+